MSLGFCLCGSAGDALCVGRAKVDLLCKLVLMSISSGFLGVNVSLEWGELCPMSGLESHPYYRALLDYWASHAIPRYSS